MFLVRKVTRGKWSPKSDLSTGEIPADAVTADLRTQSNNLSFWRSPTADDDDIEEAALAIAAGREKVDRLQIVWLNYDEVQTDGQTLRDTEGRTPVKDLQPLHVDLARLDYARLGKVAGRVVEALNHNRFRNFPRSAVRELVAQAIEEGRIEPADLEDDLREDVCRLVNERS